MQSSNHSTDHESGLLLFGSANGFLWEHFTSLHPASSICNMGAIPHAVRLTSHTYKAERLPSAAVQMAIY